MKHPDTKTRLPFLAVTLLSIAATLLYIQEVNQVLSKVPVPAQALKDTEFLARLFLSLNVAVLILRKANTTGEFFARTFKALVLATLAYFLSLPVMNFAVGFIPHEAQVRSVVASMELRHLKPKEQAPTDTLMDIYMLWNRAKHSEIQYHYRDIIHERMQSEMDGKKAELLDAYDQIGSYMKVYWDKDKQMVREWGNRPLFRDSIQLQKGRWNSPQIDKYCTTNLAPPGTERFTPCDFHLWQKPDVFFEQIHQRQKSQLAHVECKEESCELYKPVVMRDATKAVLLPAFAYYASRAVLVMNLLLLCGGLVSLALTIFKKLFFRTVPAQ